MGWHRGGWYTARWVDRLLFPAQLAERQPDHPRPTRDPLGDFIPDGAPETKCGMIVEHLDPRPRVGASLHQSTCPSWREGGGVLDWSWAFVLTPADDGRRTRFHFRSRWTTAPWWFTLGGWLLVVPADFVMSRDMLHGVKQRAETLRADGARRNAGQMITSGCVFSRPRVGSVSISLLQSGQVAGPVSMSSVFDLGEDRLRLASRFRTTVRAGRS